MQVTIADQFRPRLEPAVARLIDNHISSRLAEKDDTIWGQAARDEASKRLGWVTSASDSASLLGEIFQLRDSLRDSGIDRVVLCGMGGSSLAPEVICKNAGVDLVVLDSTAPDQVAAALVHLDRTVVVVSSKSGSTVETDSQKRAFESAFSASGIDARERIVVVTDPESPMDKAARESGYRVFNADPNVGGRYSALTAFGLVPSGLAGADISQLLASAASATVSLQYDSEDNPAIWLASAMAGDTASWDKFLIESDAYPGFGDWVEQLVAESTGKEGRGVLPVVVTSDAPEFADIPTDTVAIRSKSPGAHCSFEGELGELFLLWEWATALAGYLLEINPFDQPNVESAKVAARALLDSPQEAAEVEFVDRGMAVSSAGIEIVGQTVEAALEQLMAMANEHSYFSFHVYLNRGEYPQFEALRETMAARTGRPTTFGWGPRFLHSTGQYHKGGPTQGLFIQLTGEAGMDLEIAERPFSFGELIAAQAAGDARVIADSGSPVISIHLSEPLSQLELLKKIIES